MNAVHTTTSPSRWVEILRFWQKLELLVPFDLQRQVLGRDDAAWSVWRLSAQDLAGTALRDMWRVDDVPAPHRLGGFDAYLGVFDKAELMAQARRLGVPPLDTHRAQAQAERGELEGPTCFARIPLDAQGVPRFDQVSVSPLPWALGRLQAKGLEGLDAAAFEASLASLKNALATFQQRRSQAAATPPPMAPAEWLVLLDIFHGWAGYRPEPASPRSTVLVLCAKCALPGTAQGGVASPGPEIGLFDSPLRDIERAIGSVQRGDASPALKAYLTPARTRLDLYQPEGRAHLLHTLHPRPGEGRSRWPRAANAPTSLMQQFAIDSSLDRLADAGIFSLNTPPGTGKTTVLSDLVADNLTRRARVLAQLATADDAFLPMPIAACFADGKRWAIRPLRDDLAGFEMVITSTRDGAAAEQLAKRLSTGPSPLDYLQQVAHKLAVRAGQGSEAAVAESELPRGLIAAPLGAWDHRKAFVEGLCIVPAKSESGDGPKGYDPKRHRTLWEWARHYAGPSFAAAAAAFHQADAKVTERAVLLSLLAQLSGELDTTTPEAFSAAQAARAEEMSQALAEAREQLRRQDDSIDFCESQWQALRAEAASIESGRPAWWRRWIGHASAVRYRQHSAANAQLQLQLGQRKRREEAARLATLQRVERAALAHHKAQQAVKDRIAEWDEKQRERAALAALFPQAAAPQAAERIDEAEWQIDGLWRDATLDEERTALCVAALDLHQAWLAETLRGPLCETVFAIKHLLSGQPLIGTPDEVRAAALAIWRSVFMIVPVVSCGLADFGQQFRDLGAGALGWLFIDKAAQAVPQAAVGALWRARRALVIGDPLQAEPAFPVPVGLVEALERSPDLPIDAEASPHRVSVQNLADAANGIGTHTGPNELWIGSPLRVREPAPEPMFTLANQIAYRGKLIAGRTGDAGAQPPVPAGLELGASAWVDVKGAAHPGPAVEAQTTLVFNALVALTLRCGGLPAIGIVSPFQRIADELSKAIGQPDHWPKAMRSGRQPLVDAEALNDWCRQHIGTVHGLPGDAQSMVWLVLGCDEPTAAAAAWAGETPNVLNLALARARHRTFLIGDRQLWRRVPHFDAAEAALPMISEADFLARVGTGPAEAAKEAELLAQRAAAAARPDRVK